MFKRLHDQWDTLLADKMTNVWSQYDLIGALDDLIHRSENPERDAMEFVMHMKYSMEDIMYTPHGKNPEYYEDARFRTENNG